MTVEQPAGRPTIRPLKATGRLGRGCRHAVPRDRAGLLGQGKAGTVQGELLVAEPDVMRPAPIPGGHWYGDNQLTLAR